MYRHSPSRSHRSKGFKLKHALQIFVLAGVCFWLIYQVKHSHDKKEFEEKDAKITQTTQRGEETLKFGRKYLNPQVTEASKENEKHNEDAEEETGVEEEEEEEDNKTEIKEEDDSKGDGDDDLVENDEGKSNLELDHEEEFLVEEKEREVDDEKEIEEKDLEDLDSQMEKKNSVDGHDTDGGSTNTHEAREEQYKADDASSAVMHDDQAIAAENNGNTTKENNDQNTIDLTLHEGETAENGMLTVNEENGLEVLNSTSQGSSSVSSTIMSESNNEPKLNSDSNIFFSSNGTEMVISETSHAQTVSAGASAEGTNFQIVTFEQRDNSSDVLDNSPSDSNSTASIASGKVEANPVEFSNSSINSQFVASEHKVQSNGTAEKNDVSETNIIEAHADTLQNENSDTNGRTDETLGSSDSTNTENVDELQHDTTDSSILVEDKEDHIDLDELPDIRAEGTNIEEVAEE